MDFAKKILGKYGWKEGDGLGKHNNGIVAPLKASLKFDNSGLGVDRATEFNDHWWERCFNEAASNVSVQVEQSGVVSTARKAGKEAVEISTKGYSARKLKKAREQHKSAEGGAIYEHFLKSALLTQTGGEVANEERIQADDIAVTKVAVLTDEELFKACGGRTAHKGARHGLKLSGKLARLEQQEQEMLAKLKGMKDGGSEKAVKKEKLSPQEPEVKETEPIKSKKNKRKKEEEQNSQLCEEGTELEPTKSKKKKRKDKLDESNEKLIAKNESDLHLPGQTTEPEPTKSKKKQRKDKDLKPIENESELQAPAKSKKKKSQQSS